MITAEHSPDYVRVDTLAAVGGLSQNIGCYYNEFLIVNYLNEDIFALDYRNRAVRLQQHPHHLREMRKLEVRSRAHAGARTHDRFSGHEVTPGSHAIITIPYDVLREQPVFVEELNAVLCFGDQLSIIKHPHSLEALAERTRYLEEKASKAMADAPLVVIANDPTGKIKELFIELNGVICSTKVTRFPTDPDRIRIGLRNKEYSTDAFTRYETSFTELLTQNDRIWRVGEFRLSSNRDWFEHVLEIERSQKPEVVPVKAVEDLINKARAEDAETIRTLSEENKEAKRRVGIVEGAYKELKDGDYQDNRADLDYQRLKLEQAKLEKMAADTKANIDAERIKFRKEVVATLGAVAKTVAVMVPIGIGIYKAVKAVRAS